MLTPPPEFVAARNALAKQLRGDGRRDDASAIAAIRRPSWTDWALNRAAVADPDLAGRFADAADRMRDAQRSAIAGGDADVAGALRSLRDAMAAMAKAAGTELRSAGRGADAAGVTERLTDVAGDVRLTTAVRAAVLIDDGEAGLGNVLDDEHTTGAAPRTDSPRAAARRGRGASRDERSRSNEPSQESLSDESSAAAERAALRRRLEREADELREHRNASERDLRRTERAIGEAAHARELAVAAVERAQADLAAADRRLAEVTDRRESLQRGLDDAAAALERIDGEVRDIDSSSESPGRATKRRGRRP